MDAEVAQRFYFFLNNILPWIIGSLALIGMCICAHHNRTGGQCNQSRTNQALVSV